MNLIAFVILAVLVDVVWGQSSFRSRIDIVQVTVAVTDSEGRLVTGLTRDDFQIFEDGNQQDITQFTDALAIDGDVLTLHRQLTSMTDAGAILVMQVPANNFKHTFVYRRAPAGAK